MAQHLGPLAHAVGLAVDRVDAVEHVADRTHAVVSVIHVVLGQRVAGKVRGHDDAEADVLVPRQHGREHLLVDAAARRADGDRSEPLVDVQARFQQHDAGVEADVVGPAEVDGVEARRRAEYPLHLAPVEARQDEDVAVDVEHPLVLRQRPERVLAVAPVREVVARHVPVRAHDRRLRFREAALHERDARNRRVHGRELAAEARDDAGPDRRDVVHERGDRVHRSVEEAAAPGVSGSASASGVPWYHDSRDQRAT